VVPANGFYRQKFAGHSLDDLEGLPFTTKAELTQDQLQHPPYGSALSFPLDRYTRLHQTSGTSSGRPLRWLDTPESWEWLLGNWEACLSHLELRTDDVFFFPFSFGPFLGFWTAYEAIARMGHRVLPGGGMTSTARLRFLMDHRATVVCCTPTYALHLAELAASEGIELANSAVRMLIVAGEPGGCIPATRARIEAVWGARVIDHYGMTEIGPVAIEPMDSPGNMLVLDGRYLAELIEPNGTKAAMEGELAELILTNLGRSGSPLIRYRTGDLVKGRWTTRGLLLESGILARTDDMIHVRGNNLYPSAIESVVRRFAEVAEFRIVIDRSGPLADLCVEIEPTKGNNDAGLGDAVARAIRDELLFRVPVTMVACGMLPRYEMKAKRVVERTNP